MKRLHDLVLSDLGDPQYHTELDSSVIMKPWQVTGAQWILDQEASPINGGVVADACGTGKTIQVLMAIVFAAQQLTEYDEYVTAFPRVYPTSQSTGLALTWSFTIDPPSSCA